MGVILVDLANDKHELAINWWNWRPILAFLGEANVINEEQFERMGGNGCGGQVTKDEALKAAAYLAQVILPRIKDGERIHVDGQISVVPPEPRPISSLTTQELYAAHKSCIESFISFCRTCNGFEVL